MKTLISTRWGALLSALLFLLLSARAAIAADPLVSLDWLKANLGKPGIAIVDFQPPTDYLRAHIPGAVNSNYAKDGWREERAADKVPDMFPEKLDKLVAHIGSLGIDNATHVVLVPMGMNSTDVGVATRVYWTFKVLGHDNVSILDGGMAAWTKEQDKTKANPVQAGAQKAEAKAFKASLRQEMLVTMDDVKKAKAAGVLLVDHRPEDQYVGINRHPKAPESGTLAGAKNLPNGWLTVNGMGQFRSKSQLEQLYKVANVPTSGEQINFCNTGHWASVGWFVSSELLGNKKARMYDGSMVEWTLLKGGGMEQKVKLN
ncbi:MAG: sulfurtransferase [Rhodocyclaceae bacterium]|jgi:thiosulfate/3-mercaptopyruvate sulfurtransferase|nr:sulfurtransferase [Rhodocyclaceae bacterium]